MSHGDVDGAGVVEKGSTNLLEAFDFSWLKGGDDDGRRHLLMFTINRSCVG